MGGGVGITMAQCEARSPGGFVPQEFLSSFVQGSLATRAAMHNPVVQNCFCLRESLFAVCPFSVL